MSSHRSRGGQRGTSRLTARKYLLVAATIVFLLHLAYFSSNATSEARKFYDSQRASKRLEPSSQFSSLSFPSIASPSKECTFTFLLSSDEEFPCVAVSIFSLLKKTPNAKVVLFVSENVSKDRGPALSASFPSISVIDIDVLLNPNPEQDIEDDRLLFSFTKWRIWQIDSETVIYMDSDYLVLKNLEDLCSSSSAISATPIYNTTLKNYDESTFKSGFLVIKPSRKKLSKMLEFGSMFFSEKGDDQAVLNEYHKGEIDLLDPSKRGVDARVWKDNRKSWNIRMIQSIHMAGEMNPCVSSHHLFDENLSLFLMGSLPSNHPHHLWIRSYRNLRLFHPDLIPLLSTTFRR